MATSWPVFEFYTQPAERTPRLISFSEYEKAAHAVLESLDGICDRAERSADRERLKTVLELANADAGVATPTITMRRIIRDDARRTTRTEDIEEKGTTTHLHTVLAALDSWHMRNYLLKLGLWPRTKTESERIEAVRGFFRHIDASLKVIRFEDNVRSECARAVTYLNRTQNQRIPEPEEGIVNAEGSSDPGERDDANVFERVGDGFSIRDGSERWSGPDSKGVRIVHSLVENQGHAVDVFRLDEKKLPSDAGNSGRPDDELKNDPPSAPRRGGAGTIDAREMIDDGAVRSVYQELQRLRGERDQTGLTQPERNELDDAIEKRQSYLSKYTDRVGQPRKERTPGQLAANRVRMNVKTFKNAIRDAMPFFAAHLDSAIHTEDSFAYLPSAKLRWDT